MPAARRLELGDAAGDRIEALDLAVTSTGAAVLVAQSRANGAGAAPRVVTTWSAGPAGAAWSPVSILEGALAPLRVVALAETLHLFAGPHLRHWIHRPGDSVWLEVAPAGLPPDARAVALDALPRGDHLLLAVALRRGPPSAGADGGDPLDLVLLDWPSRGDAPPHTLRRYEDAPDAPAGPLLAARGDELGLLVAVNTFGTRTETRGGHPVEIAESNARLDFFRSTDDGRSWNGPETPPPDPDPAGGGGNEAAGHGGNAAAPVTSVALVGRPERWYAFHTAGGLFAACAAAAGDWSPPRAVAAYRPGLAGGTGAWGVNAAPTAAGTRLWWIDERHRHSDRKPWNPLGGFPWSDAPDWADTDAFSLPLAPCGAGPDDLAAGPLLRLTPDLSRVEQLRVAAGGGRTVVAWAGRARVGKHPDSAGERPALFILDPPPREEE